MLNIPRMGSIGILYLSIFSFFFVGTFTLATIKGTEKSVQPVGATSQETAQEFPSIPLKKIGIVDPDLSASSALAMDLDSRVVLYEKNPDVKLFPASTTKMLTALTALDYYNLDDTVTVSGINVGGQRMSLIEGEQIKVADLISGLLIFSANDAAEVLAHNFCKVSKIGEVNTILDNEASCGRAAFIAAMNDKAKELHLENSNFTNPTGLDNQYHLSTARDLATVAIESMKKEIIREVVGTKETVVTSLDGRFRHKLTNLNELIGEVDGVLGIKTGWTEMAKENLVTYMERDGRKIVIVVLGSNDRFGETKTLIDWVFENYEWKNITL